MIAATLPPCLLLTDASYMPLLRRHCHAAAAATLIYAAAAADAVDIDYDTGLLAGDMLRALLLLSLRDIRHT